MGVSRGLGGHGWAALGLLLVAVRGEGKPVRERIGELQVDFSAGVLIAPGAAGPDLRAPSAMIARAKAERQARLRAGARLAALLARLPPERLGCTAADGLPGLATALDNAPFESVEWGSDGSLRASFRVPLADLTRAAGPGGDAVRVDSAPHPALFTDGPCATARPAPPIFESLAEARAAIPALANAKVLKGGAKTGAAAVVRRER